MYFGLSHACFCTSVGKENKSSCFFNCYHNFNGLVLNCTKWKEKNYSFCFCRRGCGRVAGSDELWFQVLSQRMTSLQLLGFTAQFLKSAAYNFCSCTC